MRKRVILIIISLLLLSAIIYFSNISKIISTISEANISFIFLIFFIWFIGIFFRAGRWSYLLKKADINIKYFNLVKIYIPGLFLSNFTPGKTGDPLRCVLLKQTTNTSIGRSISSIIFERILDIFSLIFFASLSIPLLLNKFPNFFYWFILAVSIYVVAIVLAIFFISSKKRTKKFINIFYKLFSFIKFVKKSKNKLNDFAINLSNTFSKYHEIKTLLISFLFSLIIWGLEALVLYIAFLSIGINTSILITFSIFSITILLSVLSFLPGGLGSAELILIFTFTTLYSLELSQITSAALLGRIPYILYAILGAILLSMLKYKYKIL